MPATRPRVAIVGGGLAGLAAAIALSEHDLSVTLFERRRHLGGRAGSFWDSASERWVDLCQHINLGCCVNYADFCRRAGISSMFRRLTRLLFVGPEGQACSLSAARLPAPLHLLPALFTLKFLTWTERLSVVSALGRMAADRRTHSATTTMRNWLRAQGQSDRVIRRFWSVVVVSALSEDVDFVSFDAARKVFVDGFMAHPTGYVVEVPTVPLQQLYERVAHRLSASGVDLRNESAVVQLAGDGTRVCGVRLQQDVTVDCDAAIVAVPWRSVYDLLPDDMVDRLPNAAEWRTLPSASISALHLWFDRPVMPVEHAVLVERLSQWVFRRPHDSVAPSNEEYCQVVISASSGLTSRPREEVLQEVLDDLRGVWPEFGCAKLLRWRLITQQDAVFSPRVESAALRASPTCGVPNLFLAGDWTRTGWPSTMESAVRGGYVAAERLLQSLGIDAKLVLPEPRTWLTRRLLPTVDYGPRD